jgi:hypothetical protein
VESRFFVSGAPAVSGTLWHQATDTKAKPPPPEPAMRQERTVQASIFDAFAGHEIGRELKAMSEWLDAHRALLSLVAENLRRDGVRATGRQGLPAEAVLRCALLKQYRQLSYEELAFHLEDSADAACERRAEEARAGSRRAAGQHRHRGADARAERQQPVVGCGAGDGPPIAGGGCLSRLHRPRLA